MLGTKRRAPSTLERDSSTPASSKRLKPNHPHQPLQAPDQRGSTTGTWLTPIWNSLKSLVGATPTTQSAITPHSSRSTRRNDSNRSRQKPLSQNRVAPVLPPSSSTPFGRIHDDWIWQTMNAKQRGQPAPPEPAIVRELRARMERQTLLERQAGVNARNHNRASSNGGESQTSTTYQRKKPMGSKENPLHQPPSTVPTSRQSRIPTPEFLRSPSPDSDSSSENDDIRKRSQRRLFRFVTESLPSSSNPPSASPPPNSLNRKSTFDPPPPFFSSTWLPESLAILQRKQHRLALQNRDHSTLESLRSLPSTPPSSTTTPTMNSLEDVDANFRVYREGVRNLVRQQDDEEQQSYRPSTIRTTSSLLGPPSATYASVLSRQTLLKSTSTPTSTRTGRPLSKVDRTLENYHKTQTDSPASRLNKAFLQFERLRLQQEEELAKAEALELEELEKSKEPPKQRYRKWPKKVPREIQDRVGQIMKQASSGGGYEKTIPGASVDTKAIRRLKPGTWLDDSIIGFYQVLINNRFEKQVKEAGGDKGDKAMGEREMKLKKVWCFNSFFWNMYKENGYKRVKKWTKKFDAFEKDVLIFPINIGNSHWTCAAINVREKRFEYYDSLGGRMGSAYSQMRKWLQEEHECKKGGPIDLSDWEDYWDDDVPQQNNSNDCGVFTCAFMESLSREVTSFDFDQTQMPYLRQKIAYEIDRAELLPEEFED
ncbi:hypothetical protein JCM16303_001134 [Sporobolomyces ruberrimus]